MVLNVFAQYFPLALFFASEKKYTSGAAMESAIQPPFHKQVCSVSGAIYQKSKECRAFCQWLGQQFTDGEPDWEEGGVATL
jgi:hypothetical protein